MDAKISEIYLEKSKNCFEEAQFLFEDNRFNGSASRSYFAFYNAIQALLNTQNIQLNTHSQIHFAFIQNFVKTKFLPVSTSTDLTKIFKKRQDTDYEAIFMNKIEAQESLKGASKFINLVEIYLKKEHFI